MAAATIASSKFHQAGDCQFITFNLTSVADTNTLSTGLCEVDNIIVSTKTAATPTYAGWSSATSGGQVVITFDMQATASLTVTVIGR